jgi:hypothetical protein
MPSSALGRDVLQELDAVLVEIAEGVGLDAVGDQSNQEMAGVGAPARVSRSVSATGA